VVIFIRKISHFFFGRCFPHIWIYEDVINRGSVWPKQFKICKFCGKAKERVL
jgi:hypothetical protein